MSRALVLALLLVPLLTQSCAHSPLAKITGGGELPKELSNDLQQKFEIKDTPPSFDPPPEPKTAGKKKRRKGKKTEVAGGPVEFPHRHPSNEPIWIGEEQVFSISYFGVSAGDFTLTTLPFKSINGRKVYHIKGMAVSSKVFSMFYRLNDMVETFIDYDGVFSHRFHIQLDESKQTRDSMELYDSQKGETFYWNRWNRSDAGYTESKEFQPMPRFPQDTLSAAYYLRTVPLPTGAVFTFPVVSEGHSWDAQVTVVRREMRNTPLGKVQTVVLKPETKFRDILKENKKEGDSFIWFTDDDRRFMVRLEAKVKIGTVVAECKKIIQGTPPAAETPSAAPSGTQ